MLRFVDFSADADGVPVEFNDEELSPSPRTEPDPPRDDSLFRSCSGASRLLVDRPSRARLALLLDCSRLVHRSFKPTPDALSSRLDRASPTFAERTLRACSSFLRLLLSDPISLTSYTCLSRTIGSGCPLLGRSGTLSDAGVGGGVCCPPSPFVGVEADSAASGPVDLLSPLAGLSSSGSTICSPLDLLVDLLVPTLTESKSDSSLSSSWSSPRSTDPLA
mmetsp:Transcript_30590/g.66201  ORF Transcript_30590/g.66201 Transcript_30590/m.66201 type:complete len:220 (-) Transcript_30590:250-909(-)